MLHIITGANGAGKTANALKWVRDRAVKENRPVCFNGRFDVVEDGELKTWKKIDIKDWQAEPDGTIFFVDECHNDLPNRPAGSAVPEYVRMLAEHRRRGFDFYLISQHPGNIDSFVRRLVGAPGWHRHLKRIAGGSSLVSVLQWDAVNPNCERNGSGQTAEVTTTPLPKEVYGWYRSATLHTAKVRIPKAVYVAIGAVVVVALGGWYGMSALSNRVKSDKSVQTVQASAPGAAAAFSPGQNVRGQNLTVPEYLESRTPRIKDFPHTAPAYDQVTTPVSAPYPAACVYSDARKLCQCYSQQGTVLFTAADTCLQIVKNGFFVDWQQAQIVPPASSASKPAQPSASVQSPPVVNVHLPMPSPVPQSDSWSQALASRNSQVRSALGQ